MLLNISITSNGKLAKPLLYGLSKYAVILSLLASGTAFGVEESTLWLPKKYSALSPSLLATAELAEKSDRCIKVVAGEMVVSKNTADHYYFVITCRDQGATTYNLSYLFPVAGDEPDLIAEQQPQLDALLVAGNEPELIEQQGPETDLFYEIDIESELIEEQDSEADLFSSMSDESELLEEQSSEVNATAAQATIQENVFTREEALDICHESIVDEAVLIGRIIPVGMIESDAPSSGDGQFAFHVELDIKNWSGLVVRYGAHCAVDKQREAEVNIQIDPSAIILRCLSTLKESTTKMLDMKILEAQIPALKENDDGSLLALIPFDASDPSGHELYYLAECKVDDWGRTQLDVKARR